MYSTNMKKSLIGIIMGSSSDSRIMHAAGEILDDFGITHEDQIISAHRTPTRLDEYAKHAEKSGFKVIIAGAGGAAHLPGMIASHTVLPVIGVPTSIGYGYGEKGVAALASMLQSCSLGLTVVNIDNGVGAGAAAANIANRIKTKC